MGNRCSRFIARKLVDTIFQYIVFPATLSVVLDKLPIYPDDDPRHADREVDGTTISIDTAITILSIAIMICGFIRAVLPFMFSFMGSAFGRKFTYATFASANYRWISINNILNFDETANVYKDTDLDTELYTIARDVATILGECNNTEDNNKHHRMLQDNLDFKIIGAGNGGYTVYKKKNGGNLITLHVTPYGPSILNEMPMYVVLERQQQQKDEIVSGYTYSGAFFKMQEWASLTTRFHEELDSYNVACSKLGTKGATKQSKKKDKGYFKEIYGGFTSPPTDLLSLKEFIRCLGHTVKQKRKDHKRNKVLQKEVNALIQQIQSYQKQQQKRFGDGNSVIPKRVILYLEGLDCSGKSSTAGLICNSLEESGYDVNTVQHNRPPTPYQRTQPWMSRCRFEYPNDIYNGENANGENGGENGGTGTGTGTSATKLPEYMALVWDRGPVGDFVYGKLNELSIEDKIEKYKEFNEYDRTCYSDEGILFFKCLFVTDKDSIAATLGKRLAHKHIVRDLRTWLYANSKDGSDSNTIDEGLSEIELHIDPTDFVAFNKYETNLNIFTNVVRQTEKLSLSKDGVEVGDNDEEQQQQLQKEHRKDCDYYNPWIVINTSKRHPARIGLLKAFRAQLTRYSVASQTTCCSCVTGMNKVTLWDKMTKTFCYNQKIAGDDDDHTKIHGDIPTKAIFQSMILVGLAFFYAEITWKYDILGINEYI